MPFHLDRKAPKLTASVVRHGGAGQTKSIDCAVRKAFNAASSSPCGRKENEQPNFTPG